MEFFIKGVTVKTDIEDLTEDEAKKYVDYVNAHIRQQFLSLNIKLSTDGKVDLDYTAREKFERIRRITG